METKSGVRILRLLIEFNLSYNTGKLLCINILIFIISPAIILTA